MWIAPSLLPVAVGDRPGQEPMDSAEADLSEHRVSGVTKTKFKKTTPEESDCHGVFEDEYFGAHGPARLMASPSATPFRL